MPFVPVPGGARVVHRGKAGSQDIVMTFGVQKNAVTTMSFTDIAQSHGSAFRARIVPLLSAVYAHHETLCYSLEDQTASAGVATFAGPLAGSGGPPAASLAVCGVVTHKTAKRGRTYTGRTFFGPLGAPPMTPDGAAFTAAFVSAWQAAFNAYKNDVDTALADSGRLAVVSQGSPAKGIAPHTEPVTSLLVRPTIATQRRRVR
jgi:hypothetical protein